MIKYLIIAKLTNEGEPARIHIEWPTQMNDHEIVTYIADPKNKILQEHRATQINIIDIKEL